jgi:quercetin dioxygenase-like cupin family protein
MRTTGVLVAGALLSLTAGGAVPAQDPAKAAPATHKVLLENDKVRVLDIRVPARGRALMHTHPTGYVEVAITDCRMRFTVPGGKTSETTLHAGDVVWSDPVTHSAENLGASECHVLNVEPKAAPAAKK